MYLAVRLQVGPTHLLEQRRRAVTVRWPRRFAFDLVCAMPRRFRRREAGYAVVRRHFSSTPGRDWYRFLRPYGEVRAEIPARPRASRGRWRTQSQRHWIRSTPSLPYQTDTAHYGRAVDYDRRRSGFASRWTDLGVYAGKYHGGAISSIGSIYFGGSCPVPNSTTSSGPFRGRKL